MFFIQNGSFCRNIMRFWPKLSCSLLNVSGRRFMHLRTRRWINLFFTCSCESICMHTSIYHMQIYRLCTVYNVKAYASEQGLFPNFLLLHVSAPNSGSLAKLKVFLSVGVLGRICWWRWWCVCVSVCEAGGVWLECCCSTLLVSQRVAICHK